MATMPEVMYLEAAASQGRFLNAKDMNDERKVCVIGPKVVETLFGVGSDRQVHPDQGRILPSGRHAFAEESSA
jgi:hypothetical protein